MPSYSLDARVRRADTGTSARWLGLAGLLLLIPPVFAQQLATSLGPPSLAAVGDDHPARRHVVSMPDVGVTPLATIVGGAAMNPAQGLLANLQRSQEHLAFVADLQASGLAGRLVPVAGQHVDYTVFAPIDAAFPVGASLGTASSSSPAPSSQALSRLVANHIVLGRIEPQALAARIAQGHGQAWLTTLDGDRLAVTSPGSGLFDVTDAHGGTARVLIAGVPQANGSLYVVDRLLEPAAATSRPSAPQGSPAPAGRKPGRASDRT